MNGWERILSSEAGGSPLCDVDAMHFEHVLKGGNLHKCDSHIVNG